MITLVVAYNANFVIGDDSGGIPWHLPEDLKYFRQVTMGKPCIMGRKTWESIPSKFKPLPGRKNIIVTRKKDVFFQWNAEYVVACDNPILIYTTIEMALEKALALSDEVCVVGGGEIYRYCIDKGLADRVIASEIQGFLDVEGFAFFPNLKEMGWEKSKLQDFNDFSVFEYKCTNPKQSLNMDQTFE